MDPGNRIIPVRNQGQAMDWGLVLASQGIAASIEPPAEEHGWQLLVPESHFVQALRAIHLYRQENKRRAWQQHVPWTGLLLDWRAAGWCLMLVVLFGMERTYWPGLGQAGTLNSQAVETGAWWQLFTATQLHADVAHLATNVTTGFLLLGLAMGSYGPGWAFLASLLAGAGGNLASFILHRDPYHALGASGMVMGALGLLTVHSLASFNIPGNPKRLAARSVLAGILLLVLFGLNPQSDVMAHLGGFVVGAFLGLILLRIPPAWTHRPLHNRLAEVAALALMLLTWALALSH